MKNIYSATFILSLLFLLNLATYSLADTNIDTSFGDDGTILQDFELGDDEAFGVAVQDDGKILVTGYSSNGAVKNLIVSRFNEDGSPDTDFSTDGVFSLSLGSGDTVGRSLTVTDDGSIIVAGDSYDGLARVAILQLTPDGFLDNSFGENGSVTYEVEDGDITRSAIELTDAGNIIVATTMEPEDATSYGLFLRFTSLGEIDTSFGDSGTFKYGDDTNSIKITSLVTNGDGAIIGGGSKTTGDNPQALLVRLTSSGAIDTSYGEEGEILLDLDGTGAIINSIVITSEGDFIAAGAVSNGEYDEAFITKLSDDGSVISDFASSGVYKTTYSQENAINAVSLGEDNTILAVGFMTSTDSKDIFVLTLEEESESQTTAVTFLETDIAQDDDIGYAAVALDSSSLFAAGSSSNGSDLDVALLRFSSDASLSAGEGGVSGSTEGVIASGFRITTKELQAITRVSVVSGGTIDQFSNSEEDVTVTRKGLVYGTSPNPAYSESDDEDDDDSGDTDSTENTTDSTSDGSIFPDSNNYYIVRSGSTNDGEGTGSFDSKVENITPGTTYYLRAYAVLSNGEVLYGNEYRFTTDDACFIATAAYGSILEKHVVLLRQFRDKYLINSSLGERFVGFYYAHSPRIADYIRTSELRKNVVKLCLFPVVLVAMFFLKTTLLTKGIILGSGVSIALLSLVMKSNFSGYPAHEK